MCSASNKKIAFRYIKNAHRPQKTQKYAHKGEVNRLKRQNLAEGF